MPFSSKSNISVVKSERKTFASDGLEGPWLALPPELRLIRIDSTWIAFFLDFSNIQFNSNWKNQNSYSFELWYFWVNIHGNLPKYSFPDSWIFIVNIHEYLGQFVANLAKFLKIFLVSISTARCATSSFRLTKGMGIVRVLSNGKIFYYYWIITKSSRFKWYSTAIN
jgi:hypothetical protein